MAAAAVAFVEIAGNREQLLDIRQSLLIFLVARSVLLAVPGFVQQVADEFFQRPVCELRKPVENLHELQYLAGSARTYRLDLLYTPGGIEHANGIA